MSKALKRRHKKIEKAFRAAKKQASRTPGLHNISTREGEEGRTLFMPVDAKTPLFADGQPSVHDVLQGALGNCYFLAAVASAVKKYPELIRQMMKDHGDEVSVALNVRGKWCVYRVSKAIPKYSTSSSS